MPTPHSRIRTSLFVASAIGAASCASAPVQQTTPPMTGNAWEAHLGVNDRDARAFEDLPPEGMRLVDVSGWSLGGQARHASVWLFADVHGWETGMDLDADALAARDAAHAAAGMRLIRLDGYDVAGAPRFAAIWELGDPSSTRWKIGLDEAALLEESQAQIDRGWMMIDLSSYADGDALRYTAIFAPRDPSSPIETKPHLDWSADGLDASLRALAAAQERPLALDVAVIDGAAHFTVLTSNAPGPAWVARCELDADAWQRQLDDFLLVGYRPLRITGYTIGDQPRFCTIWQQ